MPSILTTTATEQSTYVVSVAFTDETGASVVPSAVAWTLSDVEGNVVNSRSAVSVTPAASIKIVLSGDDLAVNSTAGNIRKLYIAATYNSSNGIGLLFKDEATINIDELVNI